jgi:hypothetical protein
MLAGLALVLLLLMTANPLTAHAGAEPEDVVRVLYPGGLPQDEAGMRRILSADLAEAIARVQSDDAIAQNGLVLDFDPVTNSQDPMVSDLAIETVNSQSETATVKAVFKNGGSPTEILYDLVKDAGEWRIRNIRHTESVDGGWDLRLVLGLQ